MLLSYTRSAGQFKSFENRKKLLKKKTDFINYILGKYNIRIRKYPLFNIL